MPGHGLFIGSRSLFRLAAAQLAGDASNRLPDPVDGALIRLSTVAVKGQVHLAQPELARADRLLEHGCAQGDRDLIIGGRWRGSEQITGVHLSSQQVAHAGRLRRTTMTQKIVRYLPETTFGLRKFFGRMLDAAKPGLREHSVIVRDNARL